jgi:hypothetical protein
MTAGFTGAGQYVKRVAGFIDAFPLSDVESKGVIAQDLEVLRLPIFP